MQYYFNIKFIKQKEVLLELEAIKSLIKIINNNDFSDMINN